MSQGYLIERSTEKAKLIDLLKIDIKESCQNGDAETDASWSHQRGILLPRKSAKFIVELLELSLSEIIDQRMPKEFDTWAEEEGWFLTMPWKHQFFWTKEGTDFALSTGQLMAEYLKTQFIKE